jgi:hypothetical protein
MSENPYGQIDWNTQEIRSFKAAFQKRTQASGMGTLFIDSADTARQKALAMLAKRQQHTQQTLTRIEQANPNGGEILANLRGEVNKLAQLTTLQMNFQPQKGQEDNTTAGIIALADRWIDLEAKCISVRNQIAKKTPGRSLGDIMLDRAEKLIEFAKKLESEARGKNLPNQFDARLTGTQRNLDAVENDLQNAKWELEDAQTTMLNIETVLVESRDALQALASELANAVNPADDIHKATLSSLYGVNVKQPENVKNPPRIPYKELLAAFQMVPPEHTLTGDIKTIEFKKMDQNAGGAYSETEKSIHLNIVINLLRYAEFKNPETGQKDQVHGFTKTTLHEIGHAVDHAYGIMAGAGKQAACGGWTEVDPATFVEGAFTTYQQTALRGLRGASQDVRAAVAESKAEFIRYMAGHQTATDFAKMVRSAWTTKEVPKQREQKLLLQDSADKFCARIKGYYQSVSAERPTRDRLGLLSVGCEDALEALTTGDPPVFTRQDLAQRANAIRSPEEGPKFATWVDDTTTAFVLNLYNQTTAEWDRCEKVVEQSVPPPGELVQYIPDRQPWTIDTSKRTIGGQPAAHQAYDKDTMWWRYNGSARQSTYVTDYQWRAPGEWFAELYAFSWLKKIEPPSGVGRAVRSYMFGGHVPPGG